MRDLAVVLIATGDATYTNFAINLMKAVKRYLPNPDTICFSENLLPYTTIHIPHSPLEWVRTTITRYEWMLNHRAILEQYEMLLFMDADMMPVTRIEFNELKTDGILAVLHPIQPNTFEKNLESTAYVAQNELPRPYYQGCLQGGATKPFLIMCEILKENIASDDAKGIVAHAHDESHLNRYLIDHPPAKVLGPEFCFPSPSDSYPQLARIKPRIKHLDKNMQRVGRS